MLSQRENINFKWINHITSIFDNVGLSYVWNQQNPIHLVELKLTPISLWHRWHILSSLGIFTHLPVSTGIFKLQHLNLVIKALSFGDNLSK
jgi:hypothetical protein